MGNTESAAGLLRDLREVRAEALEEVQAAHEALAEAKDRYERALVTAHEAGCTNVIIGEYAKRTETAIRLFLKRRRSDG